MRRNRVGVYSFSELDSKLSTVVRTETLVAGISRVKKKKRFDKNLKRTWTQYEFNILKIFGEDIRLKRTIRQGKIK